ncbi:MAG: uroporphyrinogen-III C-methyltransferase [Candidatus Latescibacteria bacterium]|nr:uroporphyrinogen-III C-methyltransferase [Candidatus Latescibacterota bacterium]NIO55261.1 uroporphyrinogen-III C-methyltransferase [Candidatus Latescibacterota bacterium]
MTPQGRVFLVGAGPGDPELITLRGVRALQQADIVLYDRLVSKEILGHAQPDAELVYVGKRCGSHSVPQEEINRRLVDYARRGKHVVRLKNGDPFVFGRGGEEADALAEAGIPFEVIPGVTAAVAAGACCGLPLTKRSVSSCVTLVTGHEDPTKDQSDINWAALACTKGTIVIYMAMAHLQQVVTRLIDSGLPADTPAAVISKATMPDQVCLAAPLEELPPLVQERGVTPPSVVIIGKVVQIEPQR